MNIDFPVINNSEMRCIALMRLRNEFLVGFCELRNGHKYTILLMDNAHYQLDIGVVMYAEKKLQKKFDPVLIEGSPAFAYRHEHTTPVELTYTSFCGN